MKKSIIQALIEGKSAYIPVKRDGRDVIRVSGHLPASGRLIHGSMTAMCKNVYLIFVKSMIDEARESSVELAKFIRWKESTNAADRMLGEVSLNNLIVWIGDEAGKGMNYRIVNNRDEAKTAVEEVRKMLKTTVFVPLKYIIIAEDL